jgi:hypothetical protein
MAANSTTANEEMALAAPSNGPAQRAITDSSALVDNDGVLGTRFSGPILSGAPNKPGLAGIAMLHKRVKITASLGAFSGIPLVFPASSVLTTLVVQLQQTFNGTLPKFNLGTTPGGLDVATIDLSVAPTQVFNNLTTILGSNWTIYASLVNGASTLGKATILISYSVPAITVTT